MSDSRNKLDGWISRLSQENLPLFAHTARSIAALSENSDAYVGDMAQAILADSSLTARVLRMANSVYYNQTSKKITTVTRAILAVGFHGVRNIALSIALIDTLLSGIRHDRAIEEMIRAYHGATQAKAIATYLKLPEEEAEEIFIAALLSRIGPLVFWCFSYGFAESLDFEYSMQQDAVEAERRVLGFSLNELTERIIEQWGLSSLGVEGSNYESDFSRVIDEPNPDSLRRNKAIVKTAKAISVGLEKGWKSKTFTQALSALSIFIGAAEEAAEAFVQAQALKAQQMLSLLGVPNIKSLIPDKRSGDSVNTAADVGLDPKSELQMSMLMELTSMLAQEKSINSILSSVLEGIYRGLMMDRVVFALVDFKTNRISAKHVLGGHKDILMDRFDFDLRPDENLIAYLLHQRKPIFIDKKYRYKMQSYMSAKIKACIGPNNAYVMPIYLGDRPKGLIYADCCITQKKLNPQDFQTFQHFCEHINIALKLLTT